MGGFIAAFGSYRSKTFRSVIFGQKWPKFGHKWPNLGHLRNFPDHTPPFHERVLQNWFLEQKSRKSIAAFGKCRPKMLRIFDFGPNLTIFRHCGGQKKFSTKKFFRRFLSLMEVQLCAKNQKKIMNG